MSALTKKHPIDQIAKVFWHGKSYAVPVEVIERYAIDPNDDKYVSIEDTFAELIQKSGEPGMLLRGLRYREGLSQIEFASRINISQTNLSAIENGRRHIGKELAKRIGEIFGIDYRLFL